MLRSWSRDTKLAAIGIFVATLGIIASVTIPEIRRAIGLDNEDAKTTPSVHPETASNNKPAFDQARDFKSSSTILEKSTGTPNLRAVEPRRTAPESAFQGPTTELGEPEPTKSKTLQNTLLDQGDSAVVTRGPLQNR
jgi:hypothetical protein